MRTTPKEWTILLTGVVALFLWIAGHRLPVREVLDLLETAAERPDSGYLLAAASLLVGINYLRAVCLYVGWFLIGDGLAGLFPERRAYTVNYTLSQAEAALYAAVTDYVKQQFSKADQLADGARRGTVGFALTTLQRRLAAENGHLAALDVNGEELAGVDVNLYTFINPAGLQARGKNLYSPTEASGESVEGEPGTDNVGTIAQGFLEMSNVEVVEEMVAMIVGQRAYEMNSKAIQTSDSMLQTAVQLKRS